MGMFVVINGKRLPIDDSSLEEDESYSFQNTVALYDDKTVLRKCYIMQLQKHEPCVGNKRMELELVKELKFDSYPTENEILYAMSEYGISRYAGVVTIVEGYEVDIEYDED